MGENDIMTPELHNRDAGNPAIDPEILAKKIVKILDSKKAGGIKLLHVEKQTILADYFVICSGSSNTQIKALAGELEYKLIQDENIAPHSIEGLTESTWVLLDYSSVIVHIFSRETRTFYNLEKLWAASTEVDISDLIVE